MIKVLKYCNNTYVEVSKVENDKIYELIERMYTDLKSGQEKMQTKISNLKEEVTKNSIQLEKIQTDIKTLAEVQQSFSEQLDRAKDKDGKTIGERLDVIDLAVTTTAKTVTDLAETVEVLKETTGKNEIDIKVLKKSKLSSFA